MTPTDTLLLDGGLRIRAMTGGLEAALGLPPDAVGARLPDVLGADDPLVAEVRAALGGRHVAPRLTGSGATHWLRLTTCRLDGGGGSDDGVVVTVADVTEAEGREDGLRRAAAEAIAASEARFRAMAETVPDILFTASADGLITYVNAQFRAFSGVDAAELEAIPDWIALLHPDDAERTEAGWRAGIASGEPFRQRFRHRTADGGYRWLSVRARPVADDEGVPDAWYGVTVDIDDRVRAEEALQRVNETLEARIAEETATVRRLAAELTVAEQTERRRIAEVLHDDLQQQLYGVEMLLSLVADAPADEAATLLRRARETVTAATALTRTLLSDLSPTVLESEDVADTARWLAQEMGTRYGLAVAVEVAAPCRVPALAVRSLAYQGLRELLFNVVKHGGEAAASVRIACADGALAVTVEDDGAGFAASGTDEGFGLTTLRDRLALAGGRLDLTSAPGAGTRAELVLPTAPV